MVVNRCWYGCKCGTFGKHQTVIGMFCWGVGISNNGKDRNNVVNKKMSSKA